MGGFVGGYVGGEQAPLTQDVRIEILQSSFQESGIIGRKRSVRDKYIELDEKLGRQNCTKGV